MVAGARRTALALPYVAVAAGIHLLESGWLAFLFYHASVAAVLTLGHGWPRALAGFRAPAAGDRRTALALGVAGALAGLAGAALMWWLWPWYAGRSDVLLPGLSAIGLSGTAWTSFAVYHALVNPFVEEGFWRGALGEPRGLLRPSDLAFAGYHAIVLARFTELWPIVLSVIVLAAVGSFWRWTYRRTGSLWPAVGAHLVADAAIMWVVTARPGLAE